MQVWQAVPEKVFIDLIRDSRDVKEPLRSESTAPAISHIPQSTT